MYQNTLQIAPFTNILRELACLQTHLTGKLLQFIIIFVIFKAKKFPGSMLSNPPSNRVALIITISCIKVNINKKIESEIVSNTL